MKQTSWEPYTAFAISVFVLYLGFGIFTQLNGNAWSQESISEGKLIKTETGTVGGISKGGSTLRLVVRFLFRLDSGEEVGLTNQPFCAALDPGSRVAIYYHKSLFFGKVLYDYCKPL